MEFFRICPVGNDLYYKHYDENGKYLNGGVVKDYKSKKPVDFGNGYYFYDGLSKKISQDDIVSIPFELYMPVGDVINFCFDKDEVYFNVYFDGDFFVIKEVGGDVLYKKPLRFYIKNNVFSIKGNFVYHIDDNDINIEFEFDIDFVNGKSYCFLYAVGGDEKLYFPYSFDFSGIVKFFVPEYVEDINNLLFDIRNKLSNLVESGLDLTPVKNELDDVKNKVDSISTKLNSFKCDVDLSSVEDKLNDIDSKISDSGKIQELLSDISKKVDVLNVLDITNKIDEKLTQLFNLKSLNGSNGSKFMDGEEVLVKGYAGKWKVEGSYPLLNNDGLTIIVYRLSQDGRVLLAPSPFVSSSEG